MKKANWGCLIGGVALLVCFLYAIGIINDVEDGWQLLIIRMLDFPSLFCIIGITLIIIAASGKAGGFLGRFQRELK